MRNGIRNVIKSPVLVAGAVWLMGLAYTPINNEPGMQMRQDINARLSGLLPITPLLTTITITGNYNLSLFSAIAVIVCDATTGNRTINLGDALGYGRAPTVIKIDGSANTCTLGDIGGSSTINGASTYQLTAQYQWVTVFDGTPGLWSITSATGGGGGGGVSSVGLTTPSYLTVTGSPITGSGTLAITGTSQSANQVLASPNGSSGVMVPRPLAGADLPNPSSSTLGGVQSKASVAHQYLNSISTAGVPGQSQPAFSDISGTVAPAQLTVPPTDFTPIDVGRAYSSEFKAALIDKQGVWGFANAIQATISTSGAIPDAVGAYVNGFPPPITGVASPIVGEGYYAWVSVSAGGANCTGWTIPGGWTNVVFTTNQDAGLFYKTVTGGDTGSSTYTFNSGCGSGDETGGFIFEEPNSLSSSWITSSTQVSGNPTAPSITTTAANTTVVACFAAGNDAQSGFTVPAGFNLIVDPGAPLQSSTDLRGGTNSRMAYFDGHPSGGLGMTCATKVKVSAGATGGALATSGKFLLAYANGPGEVDDLNIIRQGATGAAFLNPLTIWRDGETTPSVNGIQMQDLAAMRGVTTGSQVRYHSRYLSFGSGMVGGSAESAQLYLTMPFTKSIVVQLTNDNATNQIALWSNVFYHANSLPASAWNGNAHFEIVPNASYPSADTVSAYSEDTLCNVAGAGTLWSVVMQAVGADLNSQAFEEGRLRVYIDGESTASWDTSGTEDAFQDSFNWSGETAPFGTDFYGATYLVAPGVGVAGAFGGYRIFGNKEPISFKTNLKVTWTSGNATVGGVTNPVSLYSAIAVYLGS
jgi:hypothetical protein